MTTKPIFTHWNNNKSSSSKCHSNFKSSLTFFDNVIHSRTWREIYRSNKMEHESAGNTVSSRRSRAASGKLPFLMFCDKEILYHGFLCFASIVVTVTQATVLNFFIIAFFRGYYHQVIFNFWRLILTFEKIGKVSKNSILYLQVATYFLFLGDLFIVCFFAVSFVTAYRYIHHRRKLEDAGCYTDTQIAAKIQRSIYKHVLCKF